MFLNNTHFYIIRKIHKNPPVGRPIVAGYDLILTPASIYVGLFLKDCYSKFENIPMDSLQVIQLLDKNNFDSEDMLFTMDLKVYT